MMPPAHYAYTSQRRSAKHRGIAFLLSFTEWMEWWGDDVSLRGRSCGDLCMARHDDTGPYEIGNIYKTTMQGNRNDYMPRM